MRSKKPVDSKLYSKQYYLTDNEGGKVFFKSSGKKTSYRFNKFLGIANLKKGYKVLDVGCGRGEIIIQCALNEMEGLGIDYSSDAIRLCKRFTKKFPEHIKKKIKFLRMDLKKMELPAEHFDRVFMLDVIEHLYDWELKIILKKIRKALKKDGLFIIHTAPNTDFYKYGYPIIRLVYPFLRVVTPPIKNLINTKPNWKNKKYLPKDPEEGQIYNKEGHVNEQNPAKLRKMLKKSGFCTKIKLIPFTRDVKGPLLKLLHFTLSLPLIRNIFCAEIIAVSTKL